MFVFRFLLAALALCVALFSSPAHATFPLTSDLVGHVRAEDGTPLAGMVVIIRQVETGAIKVRRTNSKGLYRQLNLRPDGTYVVTVLDPTGERASVVFPPGRLLLGERMRRNAVMPLSADVDARGYAAIEAEHPWMTAWTWRQDPTWAVPTTFALR